MKKICLVVISLIIALAALTGCGASTSDTSAPSRRGSGLSDIVVLAARRPLAPGEKDACYCSIVLKVWEPLITHDDATGLPKACLATKWEMKDGGKEWIIHLRKDVRFHNGKHFTAKDVLLNIDRMKKGYKRSSFYGLSVDTYYPGLISYTAPDPYTVRLVFDRPNVNQPYKMMDFGSAMYYPGCFDEEGNFSGKAIGTGPYKIKENVLNKYVVIERNDDYYGEKGKIKYYKIRNIPNADVRYAALKAGEIDGVLDLNAIPPFLAEEIKKDPDFSISVNKSTMVRFLILNGRDFPFNDVRMRQAMSLAINRQDLIKGLYLNYAVPTQNLLNYTSPYYKEIPPEYNIEKAKKLASEVLKGKSCKVTYLINSADPMQKGEAELIAYELRDIGLDVKIQSLEYAMMIRTTKKGDYNIARMQQGLANGDPYGIFVSFYTPNGARNKNNTANYSNTEIAALLKEASFCTDEKRRYEIYYRIQDIAAAELPVIPLFYDKNIVAYNNKRIKNYTALQYGVDLVNAELVSQKAQENKQIQDKQIQNKTDENKSHVHVNEENKMQDRKNMANKNGGADGR